MKKMEQKEVDQEERMNLKQNLLARSVLSPSL